MKKFAAIEKTAGETPLQALQKFRQANPGLLNTSLTYAGRLDPMASGRLLILIGDECKKRNLYDGLDKEYEFEILFGLKSDTGDILGLAESCASRDFSAEDVRKAAQSFKGKQTMPYPIFSSRTVGGKPLFAYALEGGAGGIKIPTKEIKIYDIKFISLRTENKKELIDKIIAKINLFRPDSSDGRPGSDFRKEKIISRWQTLEKGEPEICAVAKFKATVSSGTYIRALAPLLAESLGAGGLAYSIQRRKIGKYFPLPNIFFKNLGFWKKVF